MLTFGILPESNESVFPDVATDVTDDLSSSSGFPRALASSIASPTTFRAASSCLPLKQNEAVIDTKLDPKSY